MKRTDQDQKERLTPLGWYPWYPRDFYSSLTVRSMSFTARSIYRELLDLQWENGCLTDVKRLLSIMQITAEQYSEFAPFMEELFPGGVNPKLHLLREKALAEQEMKRIAGRKSAEARRLNEPKAKVKEPAPQQEVNSSSAGAEQVLNISSTKHKHKHKQSNSFILKEYIDNLSYSEEIKSLLLSFVEHRESMKKPLSLEALKLNLKKVNSCSEAELRESIEESLSLGWQGLFPPRYKKRALPQESNIQKVNRLMENMGND